MVAGGAAGLALGALVCLLTYLGLITIPARYLFAVTSTLIALLAAGMAAQAIAFLQQANILTAFDETVWNTSWILSELEPAGRALHTLIGYVDRPTAMQLIAYAATLAVILVLMRLFAVRPRRNARDGVIAVIPAPAYVTANPEALVARPRERVTPSWYRRRSDPGRAVPKRLRRDRRARPPGIRPQDVWRRRRRRSA